MSKLGLNDDGTVTLPLRGKEAMTLPEPSISQLAEMTGYAVEADAEIPDMPTVDTESEESVTAAGKVLRERTLKTYSAESPYGTALLRLVKLLVDDSSLTLDDLPGWAASPQTLRAIIGHWQTPLAGED